MLKEERHQFILEKLNKSGIIKVADLTDELAATEMTIRRDLRFLESLKSNIISPLGPGAVWYTFWPIFWSVITINSDIFITLRLGAKASSKSQLLFNFL